jgi:hypothetical protein
MVRSLNLSIWDSKGRKYSQVQNSPSLGNFVVRAWVQVLTFAFLSVVVLRATFEPSTEKVTRNWPRQRYEELHNT